MGINIDKHLRTGIQRGEVLEAYMRINEDDTRKTLFCNINNTKCTPWQWLKCLIMWHFWGSSLKPFVSHFQIDENSYMKVDKRMTSSYDSCTKEKGVPEELMSLSISVFKEENKIDKHALTILINRVSTLIPHFFASDRSDTMQKRFLNEEVNGTEWRLHAKNGRAGRKSTNNIQHVHVLFEVNKTLDGQN